MDKEMKAKVDEFLKANGMRELCMDKMDKVSGGGYGIRSDGTISVNGGPRVTREVFNNMIFAMTDAFGYDSTIEYIKNYLGYTCPEMDKASGGNSDRDAMGIVMDRFWSNIDDKFENSNSTF